MKNSGNLLKMLISTLLLVDHIDHKPSGKVENLAKIMDRLKAYNNEFDSIYDLYAIIENLNIELNNEIVQGLGQTPNERF